VRFAVDAVNHLRLHSVLLKCVSGWGQIFDLWTQLKFIIRKLSVFYFFILQAVFKQLSKLLNRVLTVLKFSFCKGLYSVSHSLPNPAFL